MSRILLDGGHWIECDDLQTQHRRISLTGDYMVSNSVVLIMLAPEPVV